MAKKDLVEETKEDTAIYTDGEVGSIMSTLGGIYALDDAIYNQKQLQRPETYIRPLEELRRNLGSHLQVLSSKAEPKPKPEEPAST